MEILCRYSFYLCSKALEFAFQLFVASINIVDVADFGYAFGAEGGDDHGGSGADVTAGDWHAF